MRPPRWTAKNSAGHVAPAGITADVVLLTTHGSRLQVLVLERPGETPVLPGGFVGETESAEETALRRLEEKTGLRSYLEQLATFSDPLRDPRGWIPSVAFMALVPSETNPSESAARWVDARRPPALGYDHSEILATALERLERKLWWSNVAVGILPGAFTLTEAREVYDAIMDTSYDASTFGRNLLVTGLIRKTGKLRRAEVGRPAALYEFKTKRPAWRRPRNEPR